MIYYCSVLMGDDKFQRQVEFLFFFQVEAVCSLIELPVKLGGGGEGVHVLGFKYLP